jgi:hypothetical protein
MMVALFDGTSTVATGLARAMTRLVIDNRKKIKGRCRLQRDWWEAASRTSARLEKRTVYRRRRFNSHRYTATNNGINPSKISDPAHRKLIGRLLYYT